MNENTQLKELNEESYAIDKPKQMADMAAVLKNHVVGFKLYSNIKGKNYVHVEGWQFAGGLAGLYPRVASAENLSTEGEIKWQVIVEIVRSMDEVVVSRGFAVCSNKEKTKKDFDEYAILSMAQTRAIGKGYRNVIGWVMKLAGYEGTPAEEMSSTKKEVPDEEVDMFIDLVNTAKSKEELHEIVAKAGNLLKNKKVAEAIKTKRASL